jgi:hypothetical protein
MPLQTRSLSRTIPKVAGGNYQPDTGLTVKIVDAADSVTELFTLSENPASSGQYVLSAFTPVAKWGYFKVGATVKTEWGRVWLGVDGQQRRVWTFRRVEVFDSADTPTGAKGAAKTWTSGSGLLATDENGFAPLAFSVIPIVKIVKHYQERVCYVSNTPSLDGSGNVTFQTEMSDAGADYDSTHSYVDIEIEQLD